MELHWSHASSGKHGAAGEGFSIEDSEAITKILERNPEDDFECTYFRQRPDRTPTGEPNHEAKKSGGLFPITIGYNTLPSELSDGYTDSDSESDNTSNVERWLQSLPSNAAWSSTPNYLALDGSEGLEGVDEIQEDSKNIPDDSKISFTSKTEDSKVRINRNNLSKRTSAKRDESSATSEWIDRQTPHKKMERTLKMRQKIPMWTEVERKARIVIAKENFLDKKASGEADTCSLISETKGLPERNASIRDKAVCNFSKATESRRSTKKSSFEEAAYNEMMREMVRGLLNPSMCSEDDSARDSIVENPRKESVFKLCDINESKETIDSPLELGLKRARLSSTYKNLSPKLAKTKINDNHLSKRKRVHVLKTVTKKTQKQNPNRTRVMSQGRKGLVTDHQLAKPVNIGSSEPVKRLKCFSAPRIIRFQEEVAMRTSTEAWRRTAMAKAAKNKQILKTVEQIVDNIGDDEEERNCGESGEAQRMLNSVSGLEACRDSADFKIYRESWKGNRKRPMNSIENKTIGSRKPMFTNPFVENCLDKAMEVALSKYKFPQNTWEDFIREKTREKMCSAGYEPPAKKLKQKSSVPRQDFSRLNSWQSIHNYFLLYSSCK